MQDSLRKKYYYQYAEQNPNVETVIISHGEYDYRNAKKDKLYEMTWQNLHCLKKDLPDVIDTLMREKMVYSSAEDRRKKVHGYPVNIIEKTTSITYKVI